jgi:hypothetical protein
MSKFIDLCDKVESLLKEQQDPNANVVPAAPADPNMGGEAPPTDVATDSTEIHVVTNDEIKDMVLNLSDYLAKNLNESDPLRKTLKELSTDVNNSDEKIKTVVDAIINVVNPKVENPDVPVPRSETGGSATIN